MDLQQILLSPYFLVGVILIIGLSIASSSYGRMIRLYHKYNRRDAYVNITAGQFVLGALSYLDLNDHTLRYTNKEFGDAYVPNKKIVVLSTKNIDNKSVSAIAVAAHEIGHVIQHKEASKLFSINYLFNTLTRMLGWMILPLLFIGLFLILFYIEHLTTGTIMLYSGIGLWIISFVFKIISIPLELDASKRAVKLLREEHIFDPDELKQAKKVLNAAALTYVGGLFANLLKFLRALNKSFK